MSKIHPFSLYVLTTEVPEICDKLSDQTVEPLPLGSSRSPEQQSTYGRLGVVTTEVVLGGKSLARWHAAQFPGNRHGQWQG